MLSVAKNMSLFAFCLVLSAVLLSPQSRTNLRTLVRPEARFVLATLSFYSDKSSFKIVKLRSGEHITVEIYKNIPGTMNSELYTTFQITDSKDVFYDFKSTLSNLFEANIDSDPDNEIIVPVMDHNLVARLSVIKFEPKNQNFSFHPL